MLDIDLELLSIPEEIYRTKSVSPAAGHLRLTQPTVSIGLARLRKFFDDPLLVRKDHPRIVEPPVAFPTCDVKQHWHERCQLDPRSQWLHKVVAGLFLETKRRRRSMETPS